MNKSLNTNLIGIALIGLGYTVPLYGDQVLTIGLFATSGAFTNWLAIHMLFEKIPGIYGSGVIPNRFEELKAKIQFLIMEEFFSRDNVQDLLASSVPGKKKFFNTEPIVEAIDYDRVFAGFVDVLLSTPFGGRAQAGRWIHRLQSPERSVQDQNERRGSNSSGFRFFCRGSPDRSRRI